MKHTAGPWAVGKIKTNKDQLAVVADLDRVCLVDGDTDGMAQAAQQNANAKLIAAAPDLLEALEYMVKAQSQFFDHADRRSSLEAANAAITAAAS